MALKKVKTTPTKIVDTVSSATARTFRVPSAGGQTVTLHRDSGVTAGSGFDVVAGAAVTVWLMPGESLWAVAAVETTYELI